MGGSRQLSSRCESSLRRCVDQPANQSIFLARLLRRVMVFGLGALLWIVLIGMLLWSTAAIYFSNLPSDFIRSLAAIIYIVAIAAVLVRLRPIWKAQLMIVAGFAVVLAWFFLIPASNDRDWQPDAAKLSFAEINGDHIAIHNIRNCDYQSETNFTVAYYDKTFDLSKLRSLDLYICDWGTPMIVHTMMSFGFEGDDY